MVKNPPCASSVTESEEEDVTHIFVVAIYYNSNIFCNVKENFKCTSFTLLSRSVARTATMSD